MPIVTADLEFRKTTSNLGAAITANVTDGSDIFDTFDGDETTAGVTEYACIYFYNDSGLLASNTRVHISSETAHAGVNFTVGLGTSAINATEQTIADKNTAPNTVTFIEASNLASAINLGDIPAGQHKAIWVRGVVDAGTLANNDYTIATQITTDSAE
jgi:hypothetical protein